MEDYCNNTIQPEVEIGNGYGYFYNIHDIENDLSEQRVYIEPMDLYTDIEEQKPHSKYNICNLCGCVYILCMLYICVL